MREEREIVFLEGLLSDVGSSSHANGCFFSPGPVSITMLRK